MAGTFYRPFFLIEAEIRFIFAHELPGYRRTTAGTARHSHLLQMGYFGILDIFFTAYWRHLAHDKSALNRV